MFEEVNVMKPQAQGTMKGTIPDFTELAVVLGPHIFRAGKNHPKATMIQPDDTRYEMNHSTTDVHSNIFTPAM